MNLQPTYQRSSILQLCNFAERGEKSDGLRSDPNFSSNYSDSEQNGTKINHTTTLITRSLQCMPGIYVLILVTSNAWTGRERRLVIRETWGKYEESRSNRDKHRWQTFFLVGSRLSKSLSGPYNSEAFTASLRDEILHYHDIIQGDFEENFFHLPYKLQMAFEWASLYCSFSYILKTDDDTVVNTKNLLNVLNPLKPHGIYTGCIHWKDGVHRVGKYKITMDEYNRTNYPPYAAGSTMIFSPDVINQMVGIFPGTKVFKLDDVYIGMVIDKLSIKPLDIDPKERNRYWDVWQYEEPVHVCNYHQRSVIRPVYFLGSDKRWCMYKIYHNT